MVQTSRRPRTAVLASGGGTNLQALIDAAQDPDFPTEVCLVLTNNPGAYCLERARLADIPGAVVNHRDYPDRPSFEAAIDTVLRDYRCDYVCLAGFLRILTSDFVEAWRDRMLNVHPSLLPEFKGLHTHSRALEAGHTVHGCTVHLVRAELDDGPLILQAEVPVLADDTEETLQQRVLTREHVIYPQALALVTSGRVRVEGSQAIIDDQPGPVRLTWNDLEN
ncbi:MAG: phosphoribosylglycinamide formyltransferase [Alphaproteobacteria bacterium]|nr:phosphoribosylglycinamide formyltransferase [Alphaproteobacteria bacterium]